MKHQVAQVINTLMKRQNITEKQLSEAVAIPVPTLNRLRNQVSSNPTLSKLSSIANYFNISLSELVGETPLQSTSEANTASRKIPLLPWDLTKTWVNTKVKLTQTLQQVDVPTAFPAKTFATTLQSANLPEPWNQKSVVIVVPNQTPRDGDYCLLTLAPTKPMVLMQWLSDGNKAFVKSLNPEFTQPQLLTEAASVLGIVVEIRRQL